jgi:hypothetical protein
MLDENIHRVNGAPLYYGLTPITHQYLPFTPICIYDYHAPDSSPPYTNFDFLMSKITSQHPVHSPLTLTPPISPLPLPEQTKRSSVIMKVENCQIIPTNDDDESRLEHVCRWENCYK